MSSTYLVSIDMVVNGDVGAAKISALREKAISANSAFDRMKGSVLDFGGRVADTFTGAVESVGMLAAHVGALGGAAAFGVVTYGVMGLNKELENTKIALGAIFSAQGFASDFNGGVALASDTVAKMKQDVKSLPGDLGQLSSIFKTIATPGAHAGASVDDLRKMAGQTMIVAGVMGLDTHMAEREMGMLLSGRAGAHNVLGTRLGFSGDSAKELNHMDPGKRLAKIQAELAKYQPAMDAYGRSFTGLSTTLKDNVLYSFLGPATSPLFESVKHSLAEVNGWFSKNDLAINNFAEALGSKLSYAWDYGADRFKEWWPLVTEFSGVAYDRIVSVWEKVEPYASKVAGWMKDALADPNGTLDKLTTVLELYGAVKVGGMAYSLLGGSSGIAAGAKGIGSGVAGLGRAAAAGWEGMADGGIGVAGLVNQLGAAGTALATFSVGLLAAYTTAQAVEQAWLLIGEVSKDMAADAKARESAGERIVQSMTEIDYSNQEYQAQMGELLHTNNQTVDANGRLTDSVNVLQASVLLANGAFEEFARGHKDDQNDFRRMEEQEYSDRLTLGTAGMVARAQAAAVKPPKHPGAGATTIKVELNVTGTNDPGRVAELVMMKFQNLRRHPTSSPDTTNFSSARR